MIPEALLHGNLHQANQHEDGARNVNARRHAVIAPSIHLTGRVSDAEATHPQAEVFYLQKQIQSQTPMVIVLEDGERVEGCIEWYDSKALKVRGRVRTLVYKSAIKYMYKLGENGQ